MFKGVLCYSNPPQCPQQCPRQCPRPPRRTCPSPCPAPKPPNKPKQYCQKPCPTPRYRGSRGGGMMGCFFSLFKTGIIFGAGLYAGVYIAQNYQIDKIDGPKELADKIQQYSKKS